MALFFFASASGLLLLLAMPGSGGLWFLSFVALVPLILFSLTARPKQAVWAGILTGLIPAAGTLYWIPATLVNYGNAPWMLGYAALVLLALYMAVYCGIFSVTIVAGRSLAVGSLSFLPLFAPLLWAALEFARGHLFTGFPWMDLGYALSSQRLLIQSADIFGHLGLSFFIVQINCLVALRLHRFRPGNTLRVLDHRVPLRLWPQAVALVCIISVPVYGLLRQKNIAETMAQAPALSLAVLQGNIDQSVKWSPAMEKKTIGIYGALMRQAQQQHLPDLMLLPETALPFYSHSPSFLDFLAARPKPAPWILSGIPRLAPYRAATNGFTLYNSALLINPAGQSTGLYAKNHLVPFGEYVPLASFLPLPGPLVEAAGSYSPGMPEPPLSCRGGKIGVLICFESIFPELAAGHAQRGATLLVNITNDGWYDTTNVPDQTLAMTVVRAVETRRSIARAANTGISAFITPTGHILAQTPLKKRAVLTGTLPLMTTTSFFTAWRQLWAALFSLTLLAALGATIAAREE